MRRRGGRPHGSKQYSYAVTQAMRDGSDSPVCDFTFDANGNMTQRKIDWFYSSPTNFQYDELNRVTAGEQGTNGSIGRSHYSYDSNSRETATWRDEQGGK